MKFTAAKAFHLTKIDLSNQTNTIHKSLVCYICDCFILTTSSKVTSMSMSDIKKHSCRLAVKTYEEFQGVPLHKDLVAQYTVPSFPEMMLSPRSQKVGSGRFAVCTHCKSGMKVSQANSKKPPKFAIANGFAIGTFPSRIPYASPSRVSEIRMVDIRRDVNDVMKDLVAPV